MSLSLAQCEDRQAWDRFVDSSPQGNVFCRSNFLDSLGLDYELWWVEEHAHPKLGALILKDRSGQPVREPYAFSMYQGILFERRHSGMPLHSRVNDALRLVDFLLAALEQRYRRLSFCLHPDFEDLRSLSWFHYHQPELGQFALKLNYSGLIDLGASSDFDAYLQSIRQSRRYEYRKAIKQSLTIEVTSDLGILEKLYRLTFERQGIVLGEDKVRLALAIAGSAVAGGYGELSVCRDESGAAIAANLFLSDERCGYYLIGANHPDYRQTGGSTYLMLENIRRCQDRGLRYVDVCGMNSPNRGDYKASFNAAPVAYFMATWESRQ